MKNNLKRYDRQMALPEIGWEGQQLLHQAKVLVIGAGGLGCPVLQQLASAGVGTLGIVDGDCIEETNLHRQILYTLEDCGKNKAQIAEEKLKQINPEVNVIVYPEFLTSANTHQIVDGYQIIVDCTDTIQARYLINDISALKNIPMVYASIHKFEGQISVFNYDKGPSYRCLFPENEANKEIPSCVTSGVLGVLPNTLGMFQATEVLKIILGIGDVLSGKLLMYNALTSESHQIAFTRNEAEVAKGIQNGYRLKEGQVTERDLNITQFFEMGTNKKNLFIDVREVHELPKITFENLLQIPLHELENNINNIDKNQEIILFCQSGKRSAFALEILRQKGFLAVSHLKNGIQSLEFEHNNK